MQVFGKDKDWHGSSAAPNQCACASALWYWPLLTCHTCVVSHAPTGSTPANTYGLLDTAAAGDLLFSVSPRSGSVVVVDVSGGSMAPRQLLAAGLPVSSMGLAVAC